MTKYRVYLTNVVSRCVEVEADDEDYAREAALDAGCPGLMFLDHTFPDESDWEAADVEECP